jgi:hypothetical protein
MLQAFRRDGYLELPLLLLRLLLLRLSSRNRLDQLMVRKVVGCVLN